MAASTDAVAGTDATVEATGTEATTVETVAIDKPEPAGASGRDGRCRSSSVRVEADDVNEAFRQFADLVVSTTANNRFSLSFNAGLGIDAVLDTGFSSSTAASTMRACPHSREAKANYVHTVDEHAGPRGHGGLSQGHARTFVAATSPVAQRRDEPQPTLCIRHMLAAMPTMKRP